MTYNVKEIKVPFRGVYNWFLTERLQKKVDKREQNKWCMKEPREDLGSKRERKEEFVIKEESSQQKEKRKQMSKIELLLQTHH